MAFHLRTLTPDVHLYLGDAMEVMAHLHAEHPEGLADLVCTDPPYGINYEGSGNRKVAKDDELHLEWVPPMVDLMKSDTAMLLFSRADVLHYWTDAMEEAGLEWPSTQQWDGIVWDKVYPSLGEIFNYEFPLVESIGLRVKGEVPVRTWEDRGRFFPAYPNRLRDHIAEERIGGWTVPITRSKRSRRHPTAKPPKLMERALLNFSAEGDLVLDPFMGGAPVGVAAVRLGRRYIGVELDPKNFNLAVENIQRELVRLRTFRRARALVAAAL